MAVGAVGATSLLVLAMAGASASPVTPLLPPANERAELLGWLASAFGLNSLGHDGKSAVAVLFAVLAAASFLFAIRQAWRGLITEGWAIGMGIGLLVAVLATPLLFSRDVYNYGTYGRIVSLYGRNPYTTVPADIPGDPFSMLSGPKWSNDPSVYGPAFTLVSAGITSLFRGVGAVTLAFRMLASAAAVGTLFAIRSIARALAPERTVFAIVLFAWNPIVVFNAVGGGHNDLLVALAVAASMALVIARRPSLAVAVLTLGALVKASAGIPLLLLLVWLIARTPKGERLARAWRPLAIAFGITLAAALPFMQTENPTLGLVEVAGHSGGFSVSAFLERAVAAVGGGFGRALATVVHVGFLVGFLAVFVVLCVRVARPRSEEGQVRELGAAWAWALVVFLLASPFMLPWYLAWLLPVAFLLPRVGRGVVLVMVSAGIVLQVVSEPLRSVGWYAGITLIRDWAVRPVVFGVLCIVVVRELWWRLRSGAPLTDEPAEVTAGRSKSVGKDAAEPIEA